MVVLMLTLLNGIVLKLSLLNDNDWNDLFLFTGPLLLLSLIVLRHARSGDKPMMSRQSPGLRKHFMHAPGGGAQAATIPGNEPNDPSAVHE